MDDKDIICHFMRIYPYLPNLINNYIHSISEDIGNTKFIEWLEGCFCFELGPKNGVCYIGMNISQDTSLYIVFLYDLLKVYKPEVIIEMNENHEFIDFLRNMSIEIEIKYSESYTYSCRYFHHYYGEI